jgi:integrase/recombinase XerD
MTAQGKSQNTVKTYLNAIQQFLLYHKNNLNSISQTSVDKFFSKFSSRSQTQNIKKFAIKIFLNFIYTSGNKQFKVIPIVIKTKSVNRSEPQFLSYDEQKRFFLMLKNDRRYFRDYVLFSFMIAGGLRLNEVLNLHINDVEHDSIILRESKTGSGKVLFKRSLKRLVNEYLKVRKNIEPATREDYLFLSRLKTKIYPRTIQFAFKKYLKLAKIGKDITPHSLRHSFAVRLRESGSDIEVIRRLLRHRHIQSTLIYSHVSDLILKDALEKI